MANVWQDRVLETSTTTGTGALTLAGAVTGYRTFASVCSVSDTVYYVITNLGTGEWETGLGTYSGANTLTRTLVHASSNAGAAVNFSAGTKRVGITNVAKAVKPATADFFTDAGNSGTSETDLYSYTTPANTFATDGDKVEAFYGGVFVSSGTATRQIKAYFGGTAFFDTGALTLSLSSAWTMYVELIRVSATVVRYMVSLTTQEASSAAYTAVGELTGLTLTGTNILKITGTAAGAGAASNDIVAKLGSVKFSSAA